MIITSIVIGSVVGLVSTAPIAAVYAKRKITFEENNTLELSTTSSNIVENGATISDSVNFGKLSVKTTSVYRDAKNNRAIFNLVFKLLDENSPKVGVGIVNSEVTWVSTTRKNKSKQTSHNYMKTKVFLLENSDELKVEVPLDDEKNMKISHVKLKIYEGKVGKTHNIQLKVEDYSYVDN